MSNFALILNVVFVIIIVFLFLIPKSFPGPDKYIHKKLPSFYTGKIIVDFADCYLITTSTPIPPYTPNFSSPVASLLDPKLYDRDTQKNTICTTIVFEKNGNKYYSSGIYKDKTTVEYCIMTQKKATIYFDKNKPENYFFDLSFIAE